MERCNGVVGFFLVRYIDLNVVLTHASKMRYCVSKHVCDSGGECELLATPLK